MADGVARCGCRPLARARDLASATAWTRGHMRTTSTPGIAWADKRWPWRRAVPGGAGLGPGQQGTARPTRPGHDEGFARSSGGRRGRRRRLRYGHRALYNLRVHQGQMAGGRRPGHAADAGDGDGGRGSEAPSGHAAADRISRRPGGGARAVRSALRSDWSRWRRWVEPLIDLTRQLLMETATSARRRPPAAATGRPGDGSTPATPPGCGQSAWPWKPPGRQGGDPAALAAYMTPRPGGTVDTAPSASTAWSPPVRDGLPPAGAPR